MCPGPETRRPGVSRYYSRNFYFEFSIGKKKLIFFRSLFIYRVVFDRLSGFSLGIRRNRCNRLLQLSDNNWVTLAVELRVYRCRRDAGAFIVDDDDEADDVVCESFCEEDAIYKMFQMFNFNETRFSSSSLLARFFFSYLFYSWQYRVEGRIIYSTLGIRMIVCVFRLNELLNLKKKFLFSFRKNHCAIHKRIDRWTNFKRT